MSLSRFRWQRLTAVRWLLCLTLALTGAQVLAYAHDLHHLNETAHTDLAPDADHAGTANPACGLCLAGHAAGGPGLTSPAIAVTVLAPSAPGACADTGHRVLQPEQLAYRSQAPPRRS